MNQRKSETMISFRSLPRRIEASKPHEVLDLKVAACCNSSSTGSVTSLKTIVAWQAGSAMTVEGCTATGCLRDLGVFLFLHLPCLAAIHIDRIDNAINGISELAKLLFLKFCRLKAMALHKDTDWDSK